MSDKHLGVYRKYDVKRVHDPAGKHANCEYFVLDLVHDRFAVDALHAYAKACERDFPELADDLRKWVRYKKSRDQFKLPPQWCVRLLAEPAAAKPAEPEQKP